MCVPCRKSSRALPRVVSYSENLRWLLITWLNVRAWFGSSKKQLSKSTPVSARPMISPCPSSAGEVLSSGGPSGLFAGVERSRISCRTRSFWPMMTAWRSTKCTCGCEARISAARAASLASARSTSMRRFDTATHVAATFCALRASQNWAAMSAASSSVRSGLPKLSITVKPFSRTNSASSSDTTLALGAILCSAERWPTQNTWRAVCARTASSCVPTSRNVLCGTYAANSFPMSASASARFTGSTASSET
mmetsp:Transcript_20472/g.57680  ORF Transcript_20472/g.57680 Transcript_20472/m.57680 type:complete len:251 (+) Transcript_20472:1110-1862(+)